MTAVMGDELADQIATALSARGSIEVRLDALDVTADEWRRTARAVARRLGRPIQTLHARTVVVAVLTDWPATDAERAVTLAAGRNAMRRLAPVVTPTVGE